MDPLRVPCRAPPSAQHSLSAEAPAGSRCLQGQISGGRRSPLVLILTVERQTNQQRYADDHEQDVKYEVFVIIDSHTVVHPRTMAVARSVWQCRMVIGRLTDLPWLYTSRNACSACSVTAVVSYIVYRNGLRQMHHAPRALLLFASFVRGSRLSG